ncbi:MAG: carboxypeptidase regulatory-like domain-containing protein [Candidatus Eremiobacteraeota bacterium]|nr:carboxypeptidase regulatory-like domain-containing protein [Candidatus Eremiobacteraeota bacterium]
MRNFANVVTAALRPSLTTVGLLAAIATQTSSVLAGTSGGMGGVITDAKTGTPIAGVRVQLTSASQTATTTTDSHGHYIAFALAPDNYTLTFEKTGYDTKSVTDLLVEADQTEVYDFELSPASASASPPLRSP